METTMRAYCGLDCMQCSAFLATKNDDDALRQKTAAEWSAMFQVEIPAEAINCEGCKGDGVKIAHCSQCAIRASAIDKGFDTCAECDDFPCEHVAFVIDHMPEARAALEALRNA